MADLQQETLWVLRAQCDDREALELLLRSALPALRGYLRGLAGATAADDILQEVLMTVCRKIRWLRSPESFRPWLYRIASRAAVRHLQQEKRWRVPQLDSFDDRADRLERDLAPPPDLPSYLDHLEGLPPACRAVLLLHFRDELSLHEVAAILEIPLGTAKSRLAYGLDLLRKQIGEKRS